MRAGLQPPQWFSSLPASEVTPNATLEASRAKSRTPQEPSFLTQTSPLRRPPHTLRASARPLISAPSNADIIGDPRQSNPTYSRFINTCYQNTAGVNVQSTANTPACDALSPTPAYRQRLAYTTQHNSNVLNIRQRIHPLVDASLFKQFQIRESTSFEIRGEFFNLFNTPNFGSPGTGIGGSTFGVVTLTQANDARIGQLTARINF